MPYRAGERPSYYLDEVGGAQQDGWMNRMVVIAANGRVQPHASRLEVKPGDVILVPSRHQFRRIDQPSTFERILRLLGTSVTSYLLLK